jgi:putative addiction module killer protein
MQVTFVLPSRVLELRTYITAGGDCPFESWFSDLDAAAAAKVTVALVRLGQGNTSNAKTVGEGVLEYRIDWGPGYRVYFGRDGATLVILLTGGTKQRQHRDIERAKELWADYKRRRKPPGR